MTYNARDKVGPPGSKSGLFLERRVQSELGGVGKGTSHPRALSVTGHCSEKDQTSPGELETNYKTTFICIAKS